MLQPILFGIGLAAATIILHALGTLTWVKIMRSWYIDPIARKKHDLRESHQEVEERPDLVVGEPRVSYRQMSFILGFTATMLVFLHVVQVSLWAVCYLMIPAPPHGAEEAFYFSAVTFTSLGYGDVVMQGSWRLMSGIQAMAGILAFGWSSALLMTTFIKLVGSQKVLE